MKKSDQIVTSDEKVYAGFAYLLGFIPAIIIWLLKKGDSPYIKFHAMQAALYSGIVSIAAGLILTVQIVMISVTTIGAFVVTNVIADMLEPEFPLIYMLITIVMTVIIMLGVSIMALIVLPLLLVNLIAAVYAFTGKEWRYPFLGDWVERILQKDWAFTKG
ncbi:MAG: DUF4870 domain-containing protein [Chloroflexota bacterium]|nr:DUF4870 domain-containing protein [Chloroflexota bacterium]